MGTLADTAGIDVDGVAAPDEATSEADGVVDSGSDAVDGADGASPADATWDVADSSGSFGKVCDKDLPAPGQPCSKVGEVRCTNAGAKLFAGDYPFCIRPNSVVCTELGGGQGTGLEWQVQPCPASANICNKWMEFGCASGKTADQCVPLELPVQNASISPSSPFYQFSRMCEGHAGTEICAGYTTPNRCTTFDQLPVDVGNEIKRVMGPCASYLSDVPYFYPSEVCSLDYIYCKTTAASGEKPPQSVPTSLNKCYVDPATGKPRCAKTCAEAGAIEVW